MTARLTLLVAILAACSRSVPLGAPAAPVAVPASPTPDDQLTDAITKALQRADVAAAAAAVERARQTPPPGQPSGELIAYFDATVHAYRGDFLGAAEALRSHITRAGAAARAAFGFHDAMIALRTAGGDITGALVECDEMVRAGTLGTWTSTDPDRMTLVRLKQHWHRAYLLRMLAETVDGSARAAYIAYAESARKDYTALAAPIRGLGDSIAVLDAYFAFCAGDPVKMREAALRVNTREDDDVEDLYLVQLALDAAGDHSAAAAIRQRIFASPPVTVLTPVFLHWMRSDGEPADQPRQFSPGHPNGLRPTRPAGPLSPSPP